MLPPLLSHISYLTILVSASLNAGLVRQAGIQEAVGDRVAPDPPPELRELIERMKGRIGALPMEDLVRLTDELRKRAASKPKDQN